jgi:hypothetical protein
MGHALHCPQCDSTRIEAHVEPHAMVIRCWHCSGVVKIYDATANQPSRVEVLVAALIAQPVH